MTYLLDIHALDGSHYRVCQTEAQALAAVTAQLGRAPTTLLGQHYDDWGRVIFVRTRPAGWTARLEERVATAFDRRECGLPLTKSQVALLEKYA